MKTFTIVDSAASSQKQFDTEATTVGELLAELTAHGISYTDKSLYEGLTKSIFDPNKPEGILPHDVMYKGEQTSDLVFMLTATKKKISSGIDRSQLYAIIKEKGLQEEVKIAFGRNFTQVSTAELDAFVTEHSTPHSEPEAPAQEANEEGTEEGAECGEKCVVQDIACFALVHSMDVLAYAVARGALTKEQILEYIDNALTPDGEQLEQPSEEEHKGPKTPTSPWSKSDLDEMFKGVK